MERPHYELKAGQVYLLETNLCKGIYEYVEPCKNTIVDTHIFRSRLIIYGDLKGTVYLSTSFLTHYVKPITDEDKLRLL